MGETCIFCLDDIKERNQVINPIGCACQIKAHGSCLQTWFEQKNQYECPICHTVSQANPILPFVHVLYVREEPPSRYRVPNANQQKCIGCCCLVLIFWSISLIILDYVYRKG